MMRTGGLPCAVASRSNVIVAATARVLFRAFPRGASLRSHVAKGKPPILILASETDASAPLPNAKRMCKRMLETGQEFEFENWPEEVKMAHISHKYGHCRMMMHLMLLDVRTGAYADHRPRHSTYTEIFAGTV
jgi:hypothetical protein